MAYESLPPAATFTSLYFLAFGWYLFRSIKSLAHRTQISYAITFFCFLRLVSFTIRIVLAALKYPQPSLIATHHILLHAGFLFLLYPTYILILKLEKFTQATTLLPPPSPLLNPLRIRSFFRLALFIGATLRIMATSHIHSNSDHDWAPETIRALDEASTGIFTVLVVVVVLLAVDFVRLNWAHQDYPSPSASSSSPHIQDPEANPLSHISLITLLISLLLLLRQIFTTVSSLYPPSSSSPIPPPQTPLSSPTSLYHVPEHKWYILLASPELIALALFSWPGLEPPHVYPHSVPQPVHEVSV